MTAQFVARLPFAVLLTAVVAYGLLYVSALSDASLQMAMLIVD